MAKKTPEKYLPKGIKILFEDSDMIIIDKAAGLLSVAARYDKTGNAHDLLTTFYRKGNPRATKELFPINRLDRETSGILLFAKSLAFREQLHEHWEQVEKKYLAVVDGVLSEPQGVIESFLFEDKNYRVHSTTNQTAGKLARTAFKVIHNGQRYTTIEVQLLTGRKNQIRVHFSEKHHPVLGDAMYGDTKGVERLALHAWQVRFTHPRTHKEIVVNSEIPQFFQKFMPKVSHKISKIEE